MVDATAQTTVPVEAMPDIDVDIEVLPREFAEVGESLRFRVTTINTGNVTLRAMKVQFIASPADVSPALTQRAVSALENGPVSNWNLSDCDDLPDTLAPDEESECDVFYVVTAADLAGREISMTVRAIARSDDEIVVEADDIDLALP